jgi:hypothetical protein
MHGEDTGDSREFLLPLHERVASTLDVPVEASTGETAVQEAAPLDVRQVMELAEKIDSFVQISRQLDQTMPGTETVPSICGASQCRRAGLKRRAADITRSSCETFAFLTTKNFSRVDEPDLFTTFCNVSIICSF